MVNQTMFLIRGHFIQEFSKSLYTKGDAETFPDKCSHSYFGLLFPI